MRKIKVLLTAMIISVLITGSLFAESGFLGGAFSDNGISTRALGMGGAFTAVADDGNASWWNPAGMALLGKTKSVSFTYTPSLYGLTEGNVSTVFASYAQGDMYGFGGLGGSINYTSVKTAPEFTGDDDYTWSELTVLFSWSMQIDKYIGLVKYKYPKVALGLNVKYIGVTSDILIDDAEISASGVSADVALMVAFKGNLKLGIMAKDIYSALAWEGASSERVPYVIRGGLQYGITSDFLLSAEVKAIENEKGAPAIETYAIGGEYGIPFGKRSQIQRVAIRTGFSIDPSNDTFIVAGGASVEMDTFGIDYTYQHYMKTMLESTHRFGITISF